MKPDNIELRHLRYFVAVVECRSFRAAALRLHVSQPPLTRQVRQLEQALGVTLLLRKARGVEPTAAGAAFFAEAKNIIALAGQAAAQAHLTALGQLGRLDVGVFGSAILDIIPRIIQQFRALHPKVEIVLHNLDRVGQIRGLRERRLTVGFNRFFGDEPDLRWEVVRRERMHVALHRNHPLAGARSLALARIGDQPLILYPRTSRPSFIDRMLRLFHDRGITPRDVYEVDDVVTAVALVSSGQGVSLVTDSACNLRLPGVEYVPLRKADRAEFDLCMIYREDDDSPLLKAFLETARASRPGPGGPGISRGRTR